MTKSYRQGVIHATRYAGLTFENRGDHWRFMADGQGTGSFYATRAELLSAFGGDDGPDFRAFLTDHCYDLHYAPAAGARPFSFGHGNLWRIATDYPGSPVPPCVHRAPDTQPGDPPRLLLIS
jgi:hypothetical protein